MKIDFERVYFDEESKYLLFRSKPERFYMLRVMDFDGGLRFGKTIKNPEIIESGSGVIGEYLLTKKEFDLWDTDEEAFNALVASISKNAPADRVLKIYYQLSPDAPQNDLEINPGQPTETKTNLVEEMKDMFQQERSASVKKFMDFIYGREDDDIYFIYSGNMKAAGTRRTVPIVPFPFRSKGNPRRLPGVLCTGEIRDQASSVSMESLASTVTFRS